MCLSSSETGVGLASKKRITKRRLRIHRIERGCEEYATALPYSVQFTYYKIIPTQEFGVKDLKDITIKFSVYSVLCSIYLTVKQNHNRCQVNVDKIEKYSVFPAFT